MIRSFADKETEKIFGRDFSRKLPSDIQQIARRKLEVLDAAESLNDLRVPPSNRLEKLKGERAISTAFASTTNGEFVLNDAAQMLTQLRLSIIIEVYL